MGVTANTPFSAMPTGTLDRKGRVCIPANYRHILAAQNTSGVHVRKALLTPSLECFGSHVVQTFHDAQAQNDPFFTSARHATAFALFAMNQELAIDETGRVRLPDDFIAHAGLSESVTFVGMGRKFEIWDTARFAPVCEEWLEAARTELKAQQAAIP